jgi:hypothetical protein
MLPPGILRGPNSAFICRTEAKVPPSLTWLVFAAQCAWIFSFVAFFFEKNKTFFAIYEKSKEISEQ